MGCFKASKHLLILSPGFPEDERDFLCIPPLQAFLKNLKQCYPTIQINVIALHYPPKRRLYKWHGIQVFTPQGYNNRFPKSWLSKYEVWKYIQQLHQQKQLDVIHSFWLGDCAFLGDLVARKLQLKHLTTLMGQDVKPSNRWQKYPFSKRHNCVFLSEGQFNTANYKALNTSIIPWGIAVNELPDLNKGDRPIDILGVGSLIPLKRFDWFLNVCAVLIQSFPTLRITLIGDGEEKEKLQTLSIHLGLSENIIFTGLLPREEVLHQMNQSKIFLHTSSFESQGYVFNEALAMGMKLVSTPVGIANKSGNWLIANTIHELTKKTNQLLKDWDSPNQTIPTTINQTIDQYFKLYDFH